MPDVKDIVAVAGSGAMGAGIAQVAALAGHKVYLYDTNKDAVSRALQGISVSLDKLVEKGKITNREASDCKNSMTAASGIADFKGARIFIEAVVENLTVKMELFSKVEEFLPADAVLASNTSSLSVTAIASACKDPSRVLGWHFFNPAFLMPLVEVIPALQTKPALSHSSVELMKNWGKIPVLAKDTPGFIVNRVARPFYGESLRILEEGIADVSTIDWALKTFGNFKMGPFELMDLIGNDVNYTVTETVWSQMYYDTRYRPSVIQKRMTEARRFGRKTGIGYYDYSPGAVLPSPVKDEKTGMEIFLRVICMLINEAAEAYYLKIATKEELDLAMTKGVNYPKGLLRWADEIGIREVFEHLMYLHEFYGDDRYRPSVQLRNMAETGMHFY